VIVVGTHADRVTDKNTLTENLSLVKTMYGYKENQMEGVYVVHGLSVMFILLKVSIMTALLKFVHSCRLSSDNGQCGCEQCDRCWDQGSEREDLYCS